MSGKMSGECPEVGIVLGGYPDPQSGFQVSVRVAVAICATQVNTHTHTPSQTLQRLTDTQTDSFWPVIDYKPSQLSFKKLMAAALF